nr:MULTISPECIES: hypothetical protein [unclassified Parasaccharibacter]
MSRTQAGPDNRGRTSNLQDQVSLVGIHRAGSPVRAIPRISITRLAITDERPRPYTEGQSVS